MATEKAVQRSSALSKSGVLVEAAAANIDAKLHDTGDTGSMPQNLSQQRTQVLAASAATLGALAMGMVIGWSSPVQTKLEGVFSFEVSPAEFAWVGSVVPLGAAVACLPTGLLLDVVGRKMTMLAIAVPFMLGWAFIIWPAAVEMLIVGRFLAGFCGGIFCVASPLYITEIAETKIRGLLSSFYQLLLCMGVELAYIIGAYTPVFWFSIICAIAPLAFAACFVFVPETPQYLLRRGREAEARQALQWFRGPLYNVSSELADMTLSVEQAMRNKVSFTHMFKDRVARKGILILVGLMALQQLCGINAVIFYSNYIFESAGTGISPRVSAIIVGGTMALFTLPAVAIVEKAGRKMLMIISAVGMGIFITILGFYFFFQEELASQGWLPLTTLVVYIMLFSLGAGPVPWIVGAEIFAPEVRGPASSIGGFTSWFTAFLVTKFYAGVSDAVGSASTFWFFGLCCVLGTLHCVFFMPETKGKSTEDILKSL